MTAGGGVDVLAVLGEVEDYFADRSDVVDGDYGQPTPNAEMNLMRSYGVALDAIAELIAADKEYDKAHSALQRICRDISASGVAVLDAMQRVETATARRASALAALVQP